ncbi:MAG: MFS transporter, partial [Candidatus Heimdallarchaeota archaeon]
KTGQMILLIIIRFVQGFFYSAAPPAQVSLLAEHIPLQERASKISNFTRIGLLGAFLGTLIGGLIFSLFSEIFSLVVRDIFIVLFIWSILLSLFASMLFYTSVPDYRHYNVLDPSHLIQEHVVQISPSHLNLFNRIRAYLQKFSNFWRFCIFASFFYFAVNLAAPFFVILTIEAYGLSFFATALLTSISTLTQFLANLYMTKTRILDRFGRKLPQVCGLFFVSFATFSVVVPYYIGVPRFEWCFVTWIFLGIGWGVFNGSLAVFLLDLVHPQYRMPLIASYNSVTGLAMFIGSIGGGMIVEIFDNLIFVFLLRTLLILFSLGFLFRVKEPEIPGIITHPFRYLFEKYTRLGTERGSAVTFLPVWLRKVSSRNLITLKKRKIEPPRN